MPVIWRILLWINQLNQSNDMGLRLAKLAHVYDLSIFGNSFLLLNVKTYKYPLVLKSKHVSHDSILGGDLLPKTWVKEGRIYLLLPRILRFTFLFSLL